MTDLEKAKQQRNRALYWFAAFEIPFALYFLLSLLKLIPFSIVYFALFLLLTSIPALYIVYTSHRLQKIQEMQIPDDPAFIEALRKMMQANNLNDLHNHYQSANREFFQHKYITKKTFETRLSQLKN